MRFLTPKIPTFNPSQKDLLIVESVGKQILRGILIFIVISNVFLFLRIFLRLFGADPENPFAAFIFVISGIFLLPFFGIFPTFRDEIIPGEMTFDVSAFVAGFCYNVLMVMALIVIQIVKSMLRTRKQTKETVEKGKPINTTPIDQSFTHGRT